MTLPGLTNRLSETQTESYISGDYAFITQKSLYEIELAKDCNLVALKERFFEVYYGMAFPEGSPLIKIFNRR